MQRKSENAGFTEPLGNVMNEIFTLTLPVDNKMKSPVQNFQQRYLGNGRNFLVFFSIVLCTS